MKKSREITLKIEGMSSPCCAEEIKEDLLKIEGVKKVSTYFADKIIRVEIDTEKVTKEQLIAAVKEVGYEAVVSEGKEKIKFERQLKDLAEKYGISFQVLQDHWNFVKEASAKVFGDCCKWCHLHRITEMADAEAFCKSAIAEGMGEPETADQLFKIEKKVNPVRKDRALTPTLSRSKERVLCSSLPQGMGLSNGVKALTDDEIKKLTAERYGKFAAKYAEIGNPCPIRKKQVGDLYNEEEISLVPKTALNLALGCGNPVSFANLKSGEVVVDFGCGAGIDLILAAHKVGPKGRVIGVDITPQMIEKERQSEAEAGFLAERVEEQVGDIEKLELPDSFADVVISNCVIILTPNKEAAFKEAFRILKPGGRLAISDMVFSEKIDPEIKERFQSTWAGVVGGAIFEKDYLEIVEQAGFCQIKVIKRHFLFPEELFAMSTCPGREFVPSPDPKDLEAVQGKVVSIKFTAVKP